MARDADCYWHVLKVEAAKVIIRFVRLLRALAQQIDQAPVCDAQHPGFELGAATWLIAIRVLPDVQHGCLNSILNQRGLPSTALQEAFYDGRISLVELACCCLITCSMRLSRMSVSFSVRAKVSSVLLFVLFVDSVRKV